MSGIQCAFLLASGKSSRMRGSDTQSIAKPIRRVNGKYLICYAIDALQFAGVTDVYVVHHPHDEIPTQVWPLYHNSALRLHWIEDQQQLGSLYAFSLIEPFIDYPFLCMDSDVICNKTDILDMIDEGLRSVMHYGFHGAIALINQPKFPGKSVVVIKNGHAVDFVKQGATGAFHGGYAYIWNFNLFPYVHSLLQRNIFSYAELLHVVLTNHRIAPMYIDDIWDIDTASDIRITEEILSEKERS